MTVLKSPPTSSSKPKLFLNIVMVTAPLLGLGIFYVLLTADGINAFDLHWNWYSLIPIISVLSLIPLLIPLTRPQNRNRFTFWLTLYLLTQIGYGTGEALEFLSNNIATYSVWFKMSILIFSFLALFQVMAALAYNEAEDSVYRPRIWLALFGTTFFLAYLAASGNAVFDVSKITQYNWGFPPLPPPGRFYGLYIIWSAVVLTVGAIALFVRQYLKAKTQPRRKKQAKLMILAAAIPSIAGIGLQAVLPAMGIRIVPVETIALAISSVICVRAAVRYKFFTIDPTSLADTILGTMSESVITTDSQLEIQYMNEKASQLLGHRLDQVKEQPLSSVFSTELSEQISHKLTGTSADALEAMLMTPGKTIPISLLSSKILNVDGKSAAGYILVFRDISKERAVKEEIEHQVVERTEELAKEKKTLQTLVDSLPVGVFLAKVPSGEPILVNRKGTEISGRSFDPSLRVGHYADVYKLVTEDGKPYPEERLPLVMTIKSGKAAAANDLYLRKPDGKMVALRVLSAPIIGPDGKIDSAVVVFEDMTEQKVLERSKDEFFSIASHELRTPLTSIKGNTSMVLEYYKDILKDDSLREMIVDVHDSAVRLIEIVNDFLDLSRLEQGKMTFAYEEFALDQVIEGVVYEMKAILEAKKIYLKFDKMTLHSLPKVWADKNRTKQVVYNLVGNASKFTEQGGISITTEVTGDFVKVNVIDTGRGISPSGQELLFHKFQQAGSSLLTRDTTKGTGLGLYISKMIIETMGGVIKLERSEVGKGSTFSFTLPLPGAGRKRVEALQAASAQIDTVTGITVATDKPTPKQSETTSNAPGLTPKRGS